MQSKTLIATLTLTGLALAQSATDSPTGPRITPPTLAAVKPLGAARGMTVEMTLEGLNLAGATQVYFSEPGVKGKIVRVKELPDLPDIRLGSNGTQSSIDVGPLPPRNQVTVELDISPETPVGPVRFRVLTPLGTSPEGSFLVEPYFGESPDREPNDTLDTAFETYLPTVLAGTISRAGDIDHYKINVKAGEELVFENQAMRIGSTLQPIVRILAPDQSVIREFGYDGGATVTRFAHKFEKGGTYYLRIADYESSGRASNFYRILVGKLPVAVSAYPLGFRRGSDRQIAVTGFNLGAASIAAKGTPSATDPDAVIFRPQAPSGQAFTELKLALGDDPEVEAAGSGQAQVVAPPVTVNGRLSAPGREHLFRFAAKKGQAVTIEVNARRLGSDLDSFVEVLDVKGQPVERLVARGVWETNLVLRDHDSQTRGLRIQSSSMLNNGDYVMVGNELLRVEEVPDGPDEDMIVDGFGGQRRSLFGSSSEAHGIDRAMYKVQLHPPGAQFTPNGLPLARFYYRNDDGGPGYGKDSFVDFVAPADGEYLVRLRDVRGMGGDTFAYRLNIREPRPGFKLAVSPRNPNIPAGGTIPLTVTALRLEGYEGPIEVSVGNLPAGLKATKNTIAAGQTDATILLSASPDAKLASAASFEVTGKATINGKQVTRAANPEDGLKLISLMTKPDILMHAVTKVVEIEAGKTADVLVKVTRQNGFAGRVPVEVRDLPYRVRVSDSGLNGVLIQEDESERSFRILALPNAEPVEGYIYISGRVETRSGQQNSYAATEPILVRVKPASRETRDLSRDSSRGPRP
jgi:hypothetical protein